MEISKFKTVLGSILIYFSFGSIVSFGATFIYLASYFRNFDKTVSIKSSVAISAVAFPAGICAVFSLKISKYLGFKNSIYLFSLLHSISIIYSAQIKNFKLFLLFYFILPSIFSFGLIYLPILNNIWNAHYKNKGIFTGILFGTLGVSQIFFIFLSSLVTNPLNRKASIQVQEEKNKVNYFDKEVFSKVPLMIRIQAFVIFFCIILGSFMLKEFENEEILKENQGNLEESESLVKENLKEKVKENNNILNDSYFEKTKECPNLKMGVLCQPFYCLFSISFIISIFGLFLGLNLRGYCLTKINDDHFVTIIILFYGIATSAGKVLWGYVLDRSNFQTVYKLLVVLYFLATIPFAFCSHLKFFLLVNIAIIAFFQGGLVSTIG